MVPCSNIETPERNLVPHLLVDLDDDLGEGFCDGLEDVRRLLALDLAIRRDAGNDGRGQVLKVPGSGLDFFRL